MQKTQKQKVEEQLATYGYVTNFWAVKNYILRLGAIICDIRSELRASNSKNEIYGQYGSSITNYSPKEKKKNQKNFHYIMSDRCVLNKDGSITLKPNLR